MAFYQDLKLEPSQQLIKIEKIDYNEEGIDCERPVYLSLLNQVETPNVKDIYESFLDFESKYLITFSEKIYFTPLTEFMSKFESSSANNNNFMYGNNTNEFRLLEETEGSGDNSDETDETDETDDNITYTDIKAFKNTEFDFPTKYKDLIKIENVKYFAVKDPEHDTVYHLFFMQQYMIIINVDNNFIDIKDLEIKPHVFNEHTVSKTINSLL